MHAFLIIGAEKEIQEKEVHKLLVPFHIDKVDRARILPDNTIGIAQVREIKRTVALKPFRSQYKAVIIEDAQALTVEAQNALLKTLEEPPDHTIIVLLVSTNIDALLPTVVSRCQVIELTTNSQQLTPNELEVMSKQLAFILEGGVGRRLALAEEVAKDKAGAIDWLTTMILIIRQELIDLVQKDIKERPIEDIPVYLQYLKSFHRAYNLLTTTNVNSRFALETLFLSLR